jgi:hypothetical protein
MPNYISESSLGNVGGSLMMPVSTKLAGTRLPDASSAYDAAEKAAPPWSLLWSFNPEAIITVQRGEQRWNISQHLRSSQQRHSHCIGTVE